jgi:hypothetical protein
MITLKINKVPTLFIKAFTADDVQVIVNFVRSAVNHYRGASGEILFIDTPITSATVSTVEKLKAEGYRVVFRDHHGIDGEPSNNRESQVVAGTAKLKQLLGADCTIEIRRLHPACSTLVTEGEFRHAAAIIADPDADGLTGAMKAAGISYPELDADAAKLDGEPQFQVTGSPISQLLAKGMAVLPSYDVERPREREEAQQRLFADWLKAVQGDAAAKARLEVGVLAYDEAVEVARKLAREATVVAPGVVLVDAAHKELFDPGTLNGLLEEHPEGRVLAVRKSLGPIAALHGIQYSLSVAKEYQKKISLFDLIPTDARCGPAEGIISNVSFLLHVSQDKWDDCVLPRLQKLQTK